MGFLDRVFKRPRSSPAAPSAERLAGVTATSAEAPAPASSGGRRCCVCGLDLATRPAMVDRMTGLAYCSDHSHLMSLVDRATLSACGSCGFRFSPVHATFATQPESPCPVCGTRLGGGAAAAEPEQDRLPAIDAVGQWMEYAPAGDPEEIVAILDSWAARFKADWGSGAKDTILAVLDRCARQDFAASPNVEFQGIAPDGRLGDFPVLSPPGAWEEAAPSLLSFMAGPSFHLVARVAADRFALLVHGAGGGMQDLAGKDKVTVQEAAQAVRASRLTGLPDIVGLKVRGDIPALLEALRHDDYDVSGAARRALIALRDPAAVPPLVSALSNDDKNARRVAALLLAEIGDASAVEPLIDLLAKEPDSSIRGMAAKALGRLGHARAVEPLVALMRAKVAGESVVAAEALGNLVDPAAVAPLLEAAAGDDWLATAAGMALGRFDDPGARQGLEEQFDATRSFSAALGLTILGHAEAAALCREKLRSSKVGSTESELSALALAASGDRQSVELVVGALRRASLNDKRRYIEALGLFGDPRAVEPLLAEITTHDGLLASEAGEALARIGGSSAVDALIHTLQDPHYLACAAAIDVLGALGDPRAIQLIRGCLGRPDVDISLRLGIAEALERLDAAAG